MENRIHHMYNLIILDESGSMESIRQPTINGFNEVVDTLRSNEKNYPDQEHFISVVSFNSQSIKTLLWNTPVSKLEKIDDSNYAPNAMTPLYDALGVSLKRMEGAVPKEGVTYNVLVTIFTDGQENASKEFSASNIKEMIETLKNGPWTFTYIGANHDVIVGARDIGIENSMLYQVNEESMKEMFRKEKYARERMSKLYSIQATSKDNFKMTDNFYDEDENPEA